MNRLFLFIAFALTCLSAKAQVKEGFGGYATISAVSAAGTDTSNFTLTGFNGVTRPRGQDGYTLLDMQVGDVIWTGDCNKFIVISISANTGISMVGKIKSIDNAQAPPTNGTRIALFREITTNNFTTYSLPASGDGNGGAISGITTGMFSCIQAHYRRQDSIAFANVSGGGSASQATNGLTKTGDTIRLGGTLTKPTEIATETQSLSITGTGSFNVGTNTDNAGRVNITQTSQDSVALEIRTRDSTNKPQLIWRNINGVEKLRLHYANDNLFFGSGAGASNTYVAYTNGSSNLGIGNSALQNNIGGYAQTAIGHGALYSYVGGSGGVTNSGNVAVGFQAMFLADTAVGNTAVGTDAAYAIGKGSNYNTFLGYHLGGGVTQKTVQDNVIIGAEGFTSFQTGANDNVAIGKNPLYSNTTGAYNVAVGKFALYANTTGSDNTILGGRSFAGNTTGFSNVGLGKFSGFANTTGYQNVAIGQEAFFTNSTGVQNVAIGSFALNASTGSQLTAVGHGALRKNSTGVQNVGLGWIAGSENTTGSNNLSIGAEASFSNATGSNNIGIGYRALYNNLSFSNIGIGTRSAISVNGYSNTIIGDSSMTSATTTNLNVAIGSNAGSVITTGGQNTFLGAKADATTGNGTITNATAIGYNAKVGASNSLILGGSGADAVKVGINTTTPQYKLDIDANTSSAGNPIRLQGLLAGSTSDSLVSSNAGVLKRTTINDMLGTTTSSLRVPRLTTTQRDALNGAAGSVTGDVIYNSTTGTYQVGSVSSAWLDVNTTSTIKVSNDPIAIPSITGMTTGFADQTVTGAVVGNTVIVNPRSNITTDNVILGGAYVVSTNTVRILFFGTSVGTNGAVTRNFDIQVNKN